MREGKTTRQRWEGDRTPEGRHGSPWPPGRHPVPARGRGLPRRAGPFPPAPRPSSRETPRQAPLLLPRLCLKWGPSVTYCPPDTSSLSPRAAASPVGDNSHTHTHPPAPLSAARRRGDAAPRPRLPHAQQKADPFSLPANLCL